MENLIDDQLWQLQMACNRYKSTDPLADWVLYAVGRYFDTGRATRSFAESFVKYDAGKFTDLIRACLNGDRSDDGILRTVKKIVSAC